jgi:L-threonylcarbamoyladenylate synthase
MILDKVLENINFLSEVSISAGKAIMEVYNTDFDVITKSDSSPVTIADRKAEEIITKALKKLLPEVPVVGEEASEAGENPDVSECKNFWLVDPLDGTKEFVRKGTEFTVNLGLIEDGLPVFGMIYVPVTKELFYGAYGHGAFKSENGGDFFPIFARKESAEPFDILTNKTAPKVQNFMFGYDYNCLRPMSSSVKFCYMAEGIADIYGRFAPTSQWDTAAGHAILKSAGGMVTKADGTELRYGGKSFENPYFISFANLDLPDLFFAQNVLPPTDENVKKGADILKNGGLVSFPTETVYGLGADATNDKAVASIYEAKGRPSFNPLISHVYSVEQAKELVFVDELAEKLMDEFWPGSLTLVLKRKPDSPLSHLVSAGLDTAAVRMPNHEKALKLIKKAAKPIAAPSANASGTISPTRAYHVYQSLGDRVDLILDGGFCTVGVESTVLHVSEGVVTLLRAGGIAVEDVEKVIGKKVVRPSQDPKAPRSPGQLKSHYAPSKSVRLNATDKKEGEALLGFGDEKDADLNLSKKADLVEAAANLFAMMIELDKSDCKSIAISPIPFEGLGLAINDRIKRSAVKDKKV